MVLENILSYERSICQLDTSSKKKTFEFIADFLLSLSDTPDVTPDQLIEKLNAREKLGSTGIGKGVAIPHCRCPDLDEPTGLLITLERPIDFDAPDDQKVDILFVLIVPEENNEQHLTLLTELAELLSSIEFRNNMRKARTAEELYFAALNFERHQSKSAG
ncbi:MAG: PTS sugar transporter subunit IIA [Cellvibrionales bacterium]|nr:PTS sugar transporter subunit IIA [Cellvibrionales bacterium]